MIYSIYVTVGATISFDGIVDTIFNEAEDNFFKQLKKLNTTEKSTVNLVVQCGNTYERLYKQHIETRCPNKVTNKFVNNLITILDTNEYKNATLKLSEQLELNVIFFKLSTNINKLLSELSPDFVITHAGTGSLLDALNIEKVKIITVVNTSLMNNHQLEIAEKFEQYGVVTCCRDLAEFEKMVKNDEDSIFDKSKDNGRGKNMIRGYKKEFEYDILLF